MFNPGKIQGMMRHLGIKQEEIEALRVVIEREDEDIIIENPQVIKVMMQGQESWQITGDVVKSDKTFLGDVDTVMEKTGKSEEEARAALERNNGDIAKAIIELGNA